VLRSLPLGLAVRQAGREPLLLLLPPPDGPTGASGRKGTFSETSKADGLTPPLIQVHVLYKHMSLIEVHPLPDAAKGQITGYPMQNRLNSSGIVDLT